MTTIKKFQIIRGLLTLAGLSLTGCALSGSGSGHLIISMPPGGFGNASSRAAEVPPATSPSSGPSSTTSNSNGGNSDFPTPTQLSDFACVAVIVTGSDIKADPLFSEACDPVDANGVPINVGVFGGFVPVTGGTIDVKVQNGAARTIQLIGTQFNGTTCPSAADILAQASQSNSPATTTAVAGSTTTNSSGGGNNVDLGDPYLLAIVTQDISGDQSIVMHPSFTAGATPAFKCHSDHGNGGPGNNNGTPTLGLFVPGNSGAIVSNIAPFYHSKSPVSIFANNNQAGALPTDPFNIVISGVTGGTGIGTAKFCWDPTCSGSVVGPFSFTASGQLMDNGTSQLINQGFFGSTGSPSQWIGFLGIQTTYAPGTTFSVSLQPVAGTTGWNGWNLPPTQFSVVADSLAVTWSAGTSAPAGGCTQLTVTTSQGVASSLANTNFLLTLNGQMGGQPAAKIYLDSGCTQSLALAPSNGSPDFTFTYSTTGNGANNGNTNSNTNPDVQWFWVSDSLAEGTSLTIKVQDDSFEPVYMGLSFMPSITSISPTSAPSAGGSTLTISGNGFSSPAFVSIGNYNCPISNMTPNMIQCAISAGAGTSLPVTLYQGGLSIPAPQSFSYSGFAIIYPTSTIYTSIGFSFPTVTPTSNSGDAPVSCSFSPSTPPAGVSFNNTDCTISGATVQDPNQPLPYPITYTVQATDAASHVATATVNIVTTNAPDIIYSSNGPALVIQNGDGYMVMVPRGSPSIYLYPSQSGPTISNCTFTGAGENLESSGFNLSPGNCQLSGTVTQTPGQYSGLVTACSSVAYSNFPANPGDCISKPLQIWVE